MLEMLQTLKSTENAQDVDLRIVEDTKKAKNLEIAKNIKDAEQFLRMLKSSFNYLYCVLFKIILNLQIKCF